MHPIQHDLHAAGAACAPQLLACLLKTATRMHRLSPSLPAALLTAVLPALHPAVNVAGFIYVQDVDVAKGTITYLAPCAGPLPSSLLLAGAFKTYLD